MVVEVESPVSAIGRAEDIFEAANVFGVGDGAKVPGGESTPG